MFGDDTYEKINFFFSVKTHEGILLWIKLIGILHLLLIEYINIMQKLNNCSYKFAKSNYEVCSNLVALSITLYFSSYSYNTFIENKLIFRK